jgi:Ca2+/H+ antiporter, TMEM165/GDT1 family
VERPLPARIVLGLGAVVHRPLTRVPENTLTYLVGLMLATFGTFWAVEGLGVVQHGGESLAWPGGNWPLLALLGGWFLLTRVLIRAMPRLARGARGASIGPQVGEGRV